MVTERVDEDLKAFAKSHGYTSPSECFHEILLITLYGADALADLHRSRIDALVHRGTSAGTSKDRAA